ncbi:hypothetical protein J1605_000291 [Eschrichtius robustus]|uniref:CUB domain-containing protein n=1 Tax=Eschrichtius robustus TaxID=9764 RepID=A0AB34HQG0_ESCRO|nr:hypothetical protein J1605_000291 [Eschrichtius robustus]
MVSYSLVETICGGWGEEKKKLTVMVVMMELEKEKELSMSRCWIHHPLLWGAVVCIVRYFSSIPGLYPLDACGTPPPQNCSSTYPNSTVCEWEIRVKMGERVRIKFGDFDIEDSDSCHFNYLRIYNGIGVSRTEIGSQFPYQGLNPDHDSESPES